MFLARRPELELVMSTPALFPSALSKGDPPEAWKILRPLEDREVHVEILRPVYYWITARSEPLLYDFVSEEIIAKSSDLDLSVRVDETSQWINNRLLTQDQTWTETVTLKVSRGLLAALRDFGILEGASKKRIAPVYLPVESFVYIAFNLHTLGNSGERLVTHPDWRLFLMQPFVVERLFLDAHQNRLLHYEAAGKIYRIEFPAKTVEEMADDKNGTKKGYVQKDFLFKDTKIIYDQKGRKKGYLKQDYLFKDRINIFDKRGRKKGYLQKDPVFEDRTDIYKR